MKRRKKSLDSGTECLVVPFSSDSQTRRGEHEPSAPRNLPKGSHSGTWAHGRPLWWPVVLLRGSWSLFFPSTEKVDCCRREGRRISFISQGVSGSGVVTSGMEHLIVASNLCTSYRSAVCTLSGGGCQPAF